MGRPLRHLSRPGAMVEITMKTIQGRYLLRPSRKLNRLFVGILARAQELYPVRIHAVVCMSSHFHILASVDDSKQLADFMRHVNTNLSLEVGKLHDWPGKMFQHRYKPIEVSDEEESQVARLKYSLSNGCKEGAVYSPLQWPGVQSAEALLSGEPLRGVWYDRTAEYEARMKGQEVGARDFATEMALFLEPLPCWRHLPAEEFQSRVRDLVDQIEEETLRMHKEQGTEPAGARAVRKVNPIYRPQQAQQSPPPMCHAWRKRVRRRIVRSYREFVSAYRVAAARVCEGELGVAFPEDCFPSRLPFVPPVESVAPG